MGSMSASDAAPLPRLGEVYFDVRGESRSMRLSWYADTGVAVFSIWQGGTCTGTFRLPIADLPRMVEALQRGPHGDARGPRDARGTAEHHGRAVPRSGHPGEPGPEPATAAYREDLGGEHRRTGGHGRPEEHARRGYGDGSLPGGYPAPEGYDDEPTGVYHGDPLSHRDLLNHGNPPSGGYRDEPATRYRKAGYQDDPLTGRYPAEDPQPSRYQEEDPLTGRYPEDAHPSRHPEDPHPSRYAQDPLTGDYPDGLPSGDYPAGPAGAGYPDDAASRDYPGSPGKAGYSPARPYVAPAPGGTGLDAEGRGRGRRRPADQEESDLSPDSFPYGQPSAEPGPPRRGR